MRCAQYSGPNGFELGCPRNKQMFFSVRTKTNRNSICFGSFSVCFAKPITIFFGLFWYVSVFRTRFETTETNRSVSKQTEKLKKIHNKKNLRSKPHWKKLLEEK
jgi:hypothetical protein